MSANSEQHAAARECLSALVDGELDGAAVVQACGHWRQSPQARSDWHAYQLIGDVLRSDDLATDPACDLSFLQAFRARLADEPVVLAPQAAPAPGGLRRRWLLPSALAAGFVAVAGVLVLMQAPDGGSERLAAAASTRDAATAAVGRIATAASASLVANESQTFVASGQLIRDARLDRYLAAHKQFAGSSALGVPSAFLRNATADASGR